MRNGLHQVWDRRAVPVSLPLNAERVVLVIAYGDLQMRHRDLAVEPGGRWYADVVVLQYHGLLLAIVPCPKTLERPDFQRFWNPWAFLHLRESRGNVRASRAARA